MAPQGQILSNLGPFFCKKSTPIWIRKMSLFLGPFFPFLGAKIGLFWGVWPNVRMGVQMSEWGVQRGIWFTFLIAALYWMIRVSKFNRDIFKLIAACSPSPLARSGAAGRLIFDTPAAGDDQSMKIMTNLEWKKLTLATEVRFKVLKKGKSSEFNPRHDGDLSGWPTPL